MVERCHALEDGRMGPVCPTDFKTGYCPVCKRQECCYPPATITAAGNHKGVHLPDNGNPNTTYYDENGNWRAFDDKANRKYDYHDSGHDNPKHHPHGLTNPGGEHLHVWKPGPDDNYVPGPAIPWDESVDKTLNKFRDDNNSNSFNWSFPTFPSFNPPMEDKPIWEKFWDDITRPFS